MDEFAHRHVPLLDLDDSRLHHETISAIFSQCSRRGSWAVAEHIRVRACFGAVVLDLTHARPPESGCVTIDANVLFSDVKLIVPRGAEVDFAAQRSVLGGIKETTENEPLPARLLRWISGADPRTSEAGEDEQDPLVVRVTGSVVLGSMSVAYR